MRRYWNITISFTRPGANHPYSWSHDYELSIDYTDNEFIVANTWSGSMLVPRIGSEDNYCIDTIRLKFYYTCNEPDSAADLIASDGKIVLL